MRLSSRLDTFDLSGEQGELAAAAHRLRASGIDYLDLTVSNPTRAGFSYPEELIREALASPESLLYQPDPKGYRPAREAIAQYYGERGWTVDPDQLLLTSGTSEAYSFLFKLLCDPGDAVLIPSPSYPLLDYLAQLEKVDLIAYPLENPHVHPELGGRWKIDFAALEDCITPRMRAIILVQPNNPTGNVLTAAEAAKLAALAEAHDMALIIDEVFCDYRFGDTPFHPVHAQHMPVFTLNGVSKVLALPQMKLSWILMEGAPKETALVREALEIITDTFLSVNTPIQAALPKLLKEKEQFQRPILERLQRNRAFAKTQMAGHSRIRSFAPQAGWYLIFQIDTPGEDETEAVALLEKERVYLHPGFMFGLEEGCYWVVSLLTPEEVFQEGLRRIAAFCA